MCTPTDTPFNKNRSFVAQTPSMHNAFSVGEVSERALVGEHRVDRRGRNSGHHARKLGIDLLCGHLVLHSGPIRRRDLLAIELVPVDVLEPGMVLDLVRGVVPQPLRRLLLQQPRDQIVRLRVTPPPQIHLRGHELAFGHRGGEDAVVHHLAVGVVERRQSVDHLVDQDAQRPPVHALPVRHFPQDFRRQILRRAAQRLRRVALHVLLREAEVRDADVPLGVQKEVLRLQVAIDDVVLMQMGDAQHDLGSVEFGSALGVNESKNGRPH